MSQDKNSLQTVAEEFGIKNITGQRLAAILAAWSRFRKGMDGLKAIDLGEAVPTFFIAKKGKARDKKS